MGIVETIRERMAQAEINAQEFPEDRRDASGREAEQRVAEELKPRLEGTGWELVQNIRVADPSSRRQREFDFVITTPDRAVVLELKRWSGKVSMRGQDVIQRPRNRESEPINHGPLFVDLADRVELLRHRHLMVKRDPVPIVGFVVFYDDRGVLQLSNDISQRPDVIDYARMMESMPPSRPRAPSSSPTFMVRVLSGILDMLGLPPLGLPQLSKSAEQDDRRHPVSWAIMDMRRTLAEFGTWDVVEMYGGKTYYGDILESPDQQASEVNGGFFNRAAYSHLHISCERGKLEAALGTHSGGASVKAYGRNGFVSDHRISAKHPIVIHPAGIPIPETLQASSVIFLSYGYLKRPKIRYALEEITVGMLLTGRVKYLRDRGAFIDVGLDMPGGKHRHTIARPRGPGRKSLTLEQAEAWRGVKPGARVLVRVVSIDGPAKLVDVDLVDAHRTF